MRGKYTPYVRRANGREMAESLRIAFRLAFYESLGKPFFVMVQRGFPNMAIEVGPTKRDVKSKPLLVACGRQSFRKWAREVKRRSAAAVVRDPE